MAVRCHCGQLRQMNGECLRCKVEAYGEQLATRDARIAELEADNAEAWKAAHSYRDEAALNRVDADNHLERIAELERERDALRADVRRFAIQPYSRSREPGMHMRCRACERHVQIGSENHKPGCPAAPRDNGSSAKEDADGE